MCIIFSLWREIPGQSAKETDSLMCLTKYVNIFGTIVFGYLDCPIDNINYGCIHCISGQTLQENISSSKLFKPLTILYRRFSWHTSFFMVAKFTAFVFLVLLSTYVTLEKKLHLNNHKCLNKRMFVLFMYLKNIFNIKIWFKHSCWIDLWCIKPR